MSNTRKCRELHGGKLTRPKRLWKGHRRGARRSPTAAGMNMATSAQFNSKMRDQKNRFAGIASNLSVRSNRKQGDLRKPWSLRYTSDTTHL